MSEKTTPARKNLGRESACSRCSLLLMCFSLFCQFILYFGVLKKALGRGRPSSQPGKFLIQLVPRGGRVLRLAREDGGGGGSRPRTKGVRKQMTNDNSNNRGGRRPHTKGVRLGVRMRAYLHWWGLCS